ncbi:zinc finger protein 570-like isoform X1 [Cydia splendana]|uniref:zinc finger protein 570-like isoform X1 n=1 Tax=Cydia splendana TaxID=1100963 RepID=UPI002120FD0C
MHQCCVHKCRNQGNHSFPRDQKLRKLWEAVIPTRDDKVFVAKKTSKICAAHFKSDDFIKVGWFSGLVNIRRILKKGTVPSIFQCHKPEDVKSKPTLEGAGAGMVTLELELLKKEPVCDDLVSVNATSLYDVHVAKDDDGMVTLELEVVKKEVVVKEEPPCDDSGSEDVASLYADRVVKNEPGLGPESFQQHTSSNHTLELDIVKKEVVIEEPPSEEGFAYADYVVKDELALGPVCQQRHAAADTDIVNTSACGHPPALVVAPPPQPISERDCTSIGPDTSTKKKPKTCETCQKTFTRVRSLNIHKLIHTGEKPHSCNVCDKSFKREYDLMLHQRTHTGEKPYSCETCNKQFGKNSDLNKHIRTHKGLRYSCDICKQDFVELSTMKAHKRTHEKAFSCEICGKSFKQKNYLYKHKQIHNGVKPYSCHICKKGFTYLHNLKDHERIHTGERPFSCDLCEMKFKQLSTLNTHKRTHAGFLY